MDTIVAGIQAAIHYRGDAQVKAKKEARVKKLFLLVFDGGGLGEVFQRGDEVGGQRLVG